MTIDALVGMECSIVSEVDQEFQMRLDFIANPDDVDALSGKIFNQRSKTFRADLSLSTKLASHPIVAVRRVFANSSDPCPITFGGGAPPACIASHKRKRCRNSSIRCRYTM